MCLIDGSNDGLLNPGKTIQHELGIVRTRVASVLRSIEVYPEFIDLVFSFSYSLIFKYKFTNPVRFVVYISSAGSLPNTHAYACGGCDLLTRGLWPTTHLIHTHSGCGRLVGGLSTTTHTNIDTGTPCAECPAPYPNAIHIPRHTEKSSVFGYIACQLLGSVLEDV